MIREWQGVGWGEGCLCCWWEWGSHKTLRKRMLSGSYRRTRECYLCVIILGFQGPASPKPAGRRAAAGSAEWKAKRCRGALRVELSRQSARPLSSWCGVHGRGPLGECGEQPPPGEPGVRAPQSTRPLLRCSLAGLAVPTRLGLPPPDLTGRGLCSVPSPIHLRGAAWGGGQRPGTPALSASPLPLPANE